MSTTCWYTTPGRAGKTRRAKILWQDIRELLELTPTPRPIHKCRASITLVAVETRHQYTTRYCACGATRTNHAPWAGKNTRRNTRRPHHTAPAWAQSLVAATLILGLAWAAHMGASILATALTGTPY